MPSRCYNTFNIFFSYDNSVVMVELFVLVIVVTAMAGRKKILKKMKR
jgi:hypothetical protein